jgi:hypothetical protein
MKEIIRDAVGLYIRTLKKICLASYKAGRKIGYRVGYEIGRRIEDLLAK